MDLNSAVFFGAYLGAAVIGIGYRNLTNRNPESLSQTTKGKLFDKIPTHLFHLRVHSLWHIRTEILFFSKDQSENRESASAKIRSSVT